MYILTVEDSFASAHQLRGYSGKCENLHGHNWKVVASVKGNALNETGLLVDFGELKKILRSIIGELDHCNLNEHPAFMSANPSSENIAAHIARRLDKELVSLPGPVVLESLTVWESDTSRCRYIP
jgi:6-pyruvoyltetrahydropterin/6-carboxytetrahydropterin synthase